MLRINTTSDQLENEQRLYLQFSFVERTERYTKGGVSHVDEHNSSWLLLRSRQVLFVDTVG